ncbi:MULTISPECIES: replicative DNA helicase [Pelosinus]|uniref:Replicative DNA helicase n=2 Tax=Pelosinus TaxID=365348 RepID=I8RE06_9FIRM|nr:MULTISPECIES: replicative DNA helicase [Pelosinus]EIW17538.1 replicative DNA helicase [Pelosinus fermentans B4]EIW23275.1 replicative DNA helicase [Pelosinus fermentans A11]MCC5468210.1 replicative DNA helicase [Pelosinus baikalensis]OAM92093.1 replicative DNA helicase [Pelosinus fermentans DSM 17108]SDQ33219.1 replicative DNA helicase [Pelosinus fermentans]
MLDRIPPQNMEAEQAVLGAMLIEREAISKVAELLRPEDCYREAHRLIYNAMLELFNKNDAVDMVTVIEFLRKEDKLEAAGGIAYVTSLANSVPTAANVLYHARIVEEKALLRQLINAATNIAGMGYEGSEEVATILDSAEKMILSVSSRKMGGEFTPIKSIIFDAFNKIEQLYASKGSITGLSTGFKDLDKLTSGLQPSDLILIAARPSMGKTAFVLNIAQHIGIAEKKAVAFFSLEMSKEQLVQRMLCAESAIDSQRLRIGELEAKDWTKLVSGADRLSAAPIFIDDTAGITVMEMRSKARRLKIEHNLSLIIIDYLQLMQGSGKGKGSENRQQEISEISRSLKALAREINVPVIALSQLSRSVESRQVKKPMLSDLRESGSLEQDADIVAFLYRDDYYNPDSEQKNITEVIIAKHRNGPVDTVQLFFHKQFTKFSDLSKLPG